MLTLPRRPHARRHLAAAAAAATLLVVSGCGLLPGADAAGDDARASDGSGVGVRGTGDPAASASPTAEADAGTALPTFDPGTAVGGYAKGFPRDLLGAPEDATVLASSATSGEGTLTDVTLNLATDRSAQEVLDQLAKPLRKAGFEESGSATFTGLTAQTTFGRESAAKGKKGGDPVVESVTLGVLDDGERRLVTVSGSVVVD